MMSHFKAFIVCLFGLATPGYCQTFTPVPFIFIFGQPANASQVQADFQSIVNNGNAVANSIEAQIDAVTPPVSGTLMYFNLGSCPAAWTIVTALGTAFMRGLDLGRGQDTTGTGILGNELTTVQDHTHATGPGATALGTVSVSAGGPANTPYVSAATATITPNSGGVTGATAGSEARPKNVSLLLCQKN